MAVNSTCDILAPFDQSLIKSLPLNTSADVESALATAHGLEHEPLEKQQRIRILRDTLAILESEKESLVLEAAGEGGKPYQDPWQRLNAAFKA